jgi:prolyl 4-hydroxylase
MEIEIHNEDPNIYTIDNMLTTEQCQHFIDISKSSLQRAMVSGSNSGYISKGRSGSNTWIEHDHDEITMTVAKSIIFH